jgi:catechol 2,3-dioxygenase-like lactoylglutathione lyase family enzyme
MRLGAFSISLSVKNLATSRGFYEKFGFEVFGGQAQHNYLILRNGDAVIGLFQGMFERNIMTFNPGWDQNAQEVDPFDNVLPLQKTLRAQGITFEQQADESSTGHASLVVTDPDGNAILVDQHR